MKKIFAMLVVVISFFLGCKETIVEYGLPKEEINDSMHGDIIGKVTQKNSGGVVVVSQVSPIDSAAISTADGSFEFHDLRIGNYDLTVKADNYRYYVLNNVQVQGGGVTYVGELDLSTVPELVSSVYPEDKSEVVYDWRYGRITISILFAHPMDRASVENAFSTDPPSTGIFYWGDYTTAPMSTMYAAPNDARFEEGATITTFSKITSMTYQMSRVNSFVDTNYTVTLSTDAKDTSGNHLRFPLVFSFRTVQSYVTVYGIQTNPVNGDIDIDPISNSSITLTFPRRMDPVSTEAALQLNPALNHAVLWPSGNVMNIWAGGPLPSDTTITVQINGSAKDKDGVPLNETFSFWFRTAAFNLRSTSPVNAQLYVPTTSAIYLYFNNYVDKTAVQSAFSIAPSASGTIDYARDYYGVAYLDQTVFTPSSQLQANTKYTVTLSTAAKDINGVNMKSSYQFAFVTRP
ncbi:MAG: Ig-like domain-containing protein [Bacteroidota bacterium]|nr:Ig-like domain-containing protein [Bacteroidota bacterium]